MADGSKIEWTNATWNPITGCSLASPGCTNCYAMKLAGTRMRNHESRKGLTIASKAGPVWNGEVRFNEQWLDEPLRWRRPRMIFVCAHGDLFHESVPDEWIDRVFDVMHRSRHHVFQVLTKRSARMREYVTNYTRLPNQIAAFYNLPTDGSTKLYQPLPNVWLGVSVEDQQRADERVPDLLATPAAIRWLSCEPLLGPVDLRNFDLDFRPGFSGFYSVNALTGRNEDMCRPCADTASLDWIVVGGESGPGARPMHPDWARSLRDQCAEAEVPFFFKQWGDWLPGEVYTETLDGVTHGGVSRFPDSPEPGATYPGKPSHWWDGADSFTPGQISVHVGKKVAGRLLDGIEHDGMPA
jgi:protein gp37